MKNTTISTTTGDSPGVRLPLAESSRQRLRGLHKTLMRLHKVLLDDERKGYERVNGPVATSGALLNLVMYDPWFDWLHRISENIVRIDELLDANQASFDDASELLSVLRSLFQDPTGQSEFMARYRAVISREPAAVLAHIDVQKLLVTDA